MKNKTLEKKIPKLFMIRKHGSSIYLKRDKSVLRTAKYDKGKEFLGYEQNYKK